MPLAGRPLIEYALSRFERMGLVDRCVIVVTPRYEKEFRTAVSAAFPGASFTLVPGGQERQDSVRRGLAALEADTDLVIIHDAARPFVPVEAVEAACEVARGCGAATVALPCADTILEGDTEEYLHATPDRARLWACQTPQVFQTSVIRGAHEAALRQGIEATDDATLVCRAGGRVKLVRGTPMNLKITRPEDLRIAEALIGRESTCIG